VEHMQSHSLPRQVFRSLEQSFLTQLELLATHCPRICFLGKTGSGKTSLMNDVIGRELLPADDTGLAVTSSVTEIAQDPTMGEGCIAVIPSVCRGRMGREETTLGGTIRCLSHPIQMHPLMRCEKASPTL